MKTIYVETESNVKINEFINTYNTNSHLKTIMFPKK